MSFSTARKVMDALRIPNSCNYEDEMLGFTINFWLCGKEKTDVLDAYLRWDNKPGKMLVSSFEVHIFVIITLYVEHAICLVYHVSYAGFWRPAGKREGSDYRKEWLVKDGGVDPSDLQWISLIDDQRLTLNGTQPIKVVIEKSTRTPAEDTTDMREKVRIRKLEILNED